MEIAFAIFHRPIQIPQSSLASREHTSNTKRLHRFNFFSTEKQHSHGSKQSHELHAIHRKTKVLISIFWFGQLGPKPMEGAKLAQDRFRLLQTHIFLNQRVFFIFAFFKKKIYRNIFLVSGFTVLYPYRPAGGGRGPTARQGGGRDLYVNKNKFILCRGPWREPAAPLSGGRGRQAPSPNIKLRPFPLRPHFLPTRSREGRGREEG